MRYLLLVISLSVFFNASAGFKDSTINLNLPDSVKAVQLMVEMKININENAKWSSSGISTSEVSIGVRKSKSGKSIYFHGHNLSRLITSGTDIQKSKLGIMAYSYDWEEDQNQKFLLSLASDSTSQTTLISGYVFLTKENKWKLIATVKHPFYREKFSNLNIQRAGTRKKIPSIQIIQAWAQRQRGSWKNLKNDNLPNPVITLFNHIDSLAQSQIELKQIEDSISAGKLSALKNNEGVYYSILKEGTGKQIQVTDTVTVFYKGYLFSNGAIFDQTKDKPATFPLSLLIKGWQVGLPQSKVGGKIRLIIPSGLAYSIRTRSAKIPPNSILVFDVETIEAKQQTSF